MTHKELLEKYQQMEMWVSLGQFHKDDLVSLMRIFKTTIDLHHPFYIVQDDGSLRSYCSECSWDHHIGQKDHLMEYPCDTIQDIEKELE